MPSAELWNSIAPSYVLPDGTSPNRLHNQSGKVSAIAYRDNSNDKYNYMVFSYDERGRVEAVLKFVRPIGFTAMYYTYNSMNSVKTERSVDGCHTVTTYYNYNQEGLVDSVWHRFDNNGLLINNGVPATCGNLYYQALPTIPGYPDIAYCHNQLDQVTKMSYLMNGLNPKYTVDYNYNSRHLPVTVKRRQRFRQSHLIFRNLGLYDIWRCSK